MTIEEWAKDFKSYVNTLDMPRDDYKGIIEYIDDTVAMLKEWEAENGEWITIWQEDDPDTSIHARCSICNRISERPLGGYCKWCGAKMSQEWSVDG